MPAISPDSFIAVDEQGDQCYLFAPSKIDEWKDIEEKREHLVPAPQPAQRQTGRMAVAVELAAKINDIAPGKARLLKGNGRGIALFNVDGQFFARDTTCTQRGGPLATSAVSGHEVICPSHGVDCDIRTGEVVGPPARQAVARCSNARINGLDVEVEV